MIYTGPQTSVVILNCCDFFRLAWTLYMFWKTLKESTLKLSTLGAACLLLMIKLKNLMVGKNATKNYFKGTNVIKQDTCGQMNTKSHCDAKDKTKPVYEWSHPLPIVEMVSCNSC